MLRALELKVPPPVAALVVAGAMWLLVGDRVSFTALPALRAWTAGALALAGVACDLAGFLTFRRARTTINPLRPDAATALVDRGIYRLTRNPMYLGLTCLLCAWAVVLGSWWALAGPVALAAYLQRFQIAPEERALDARFGDAYRAYRSRVRRWL